MCIYMQCSVYIRVIKHILPARVFVVKYWNKMCYHLPLPLHILGLNACNYMYIHSQSYSLYFTCTLYLPGLVYLYHSFP